MTRLLIDIRYVVRQLARSPGFSLSVVLILGLGIGITTAVVSAVDHVLLRPLDLPDSERLITLCEVRNAEREYCTAAPPNVADWSERARTLEAIGVARARSIEIHSGERRSSVPAAMVTPGFLAAAGVQPAHGRLIVDGDMLPGGSGSVIVLSHELWQERFNGDPNIIGHRISVSSGGDGRVLDREPLTVIGIMPPGLAIPRLAAARAWFPLQMDPQGADIRGWRGFVALARVQRGVPVDAAVQDVVRVQQYLAEQYPDDVADWTVEGHRLRTYVGAQIRPLLLLLLAASALVLTIVCVNVATLLLARGMRRERELRVLVALGAGRGQLLQQRAVEGVLLSLAGALVGIVIASWTVDALKLLAPSGVPRVEQIAVDARVILLMLGMAAGLGLVFTALPALRLRRAHVHDVLRQGRTTTGGRHVERLRRTLVVTQLALTLALLLSAALLMRSFRHLATFNPGFDIEHVLAFQVFPPQWKYDSRDRLRAFYRDAAAQLEAVPGVIAVGNASAVPLTGGGDGMTPFHVHGRDALPAGRTPTALFFNAGPGLLPALGIAVREGRNLSADARGDIVEALISESMARRYWPQQSPIGARLALPDWSEEVEVVGVVPDLRNFAEAAPPAPAIYLNTAQRPRGANYFILRTRGSAESMVPAIVAALERVDADVVPRDLSTLRDRLRAQLVVPRFNTLLVGIFAALALALSTAGVYALMAYTVSFRRHEFGVRMAVGARASQLLISVMTESSKVLALGIAIGAAVAWYFTRLLRGVITDVGNSDVLVTLTATAILTAAALAAAFVPALRAARTDPAGVLRSD